MHGFTPSTYATHVADGPQDKLDLDRGRDYPRISHHRTHRYRRRREPEDQTDGGVHGLQSGTRLCSGDRGSDS
jgi:hypothetical protein